AGVRSQADQDRGAQAVQEPRAAGFVAVRGGPVVATGSSAFMSILDKLLHGRRDRRSRPDPDMAAVLDALAELGAAPVESLTPEQARAQPGMADAVRLRL